MYRSLFAYDNSITLKNENEDDEEKRNKQKYMLTAQLL